MDSLRYIIIAPVRNEAAQLTETIKSVAAQTIRPSCWVIVDDGSSDQTGAIADQAARMHDWIKVVHRTDRGFRKSGGGVMEAFYDGYRLVEGEPWDYLVKLDGDLTFDPDYFGQCFREFQADPALGIGGGSVCVLLEGEARVESKGDPSFHVRGAAKIYRFACWQAIGGLLRETGWDTLDEVKANMLGWSTRTFPEIRLIHHRKTGGADGTWKNWVKNGRANFIVGYHPLFMLCKCLKRIPYPPLLVAAAGLWWGFMSGYLRMVPQVQDKELIRYLRRQQINRLVFRKSIWSD